MGEGRKRGRPSSRAPDRGRQQTQEVIISRQALWLPRQGQGGEAYQDAFRFSPRDTLPYRVALAASRSESVFARTWAQLLAGGFVTDPSVDAGNFYERVARWQNLWEVAVAARTVATVEAVDRLGVEASFLGLVVYEGGTWEALSVGTGCLFHQHRGELLSDWPCEDPGPDDMPRAFVPSMEGQEGPPPRHREGRWASGDAFLLANGTLCSWLRKHGPEQALGYTPATFEAAVAEAREGEEMRDEDVTLLRVEIRF